MAEKLTPELPTPVAVTRHLKLKAAANHPVSGSPLGYYFTACSLWSTEPPGLRASFCLPPANWPTVQLINSDLV